MIDKDGFRLGVGIIVCNQMREVLWAKRSTGKTWQFPQGGIQENETPEAAVYRELEEEVGLTQKDVQLLGSTKECLCYIWPMSKRIEYQNPHCIGQKQQWFLLRLTSADTAICLHKTVPAEFDEWRWVDYWYALEHSVFFKKPMYEQVLKELAIYL